MPTVKEVQLKYKEQHDTKSKVFYDKKHSEEGITAQEQADFYSWHKQLWIDFDNEVKTASDYVAPPPPKPKRDFAKELDELKAKIEELEK